MKKTTIYLVSILCMTVYACSDFLDQEPDKQISITEQLSSKEGVLMALNGIYRDIEGVLSSREIVYADVQGGNMTFTPAANDKLIKTPSSIENSYEFSDREDESEYANYYKEVYDIINQANVILSRFDGYSFFSESEQNQLQAELLTIRAFAHYQVAIHYSQPYNFTTDASHLGVVYNKRVLIAGVDFPSRSTLKETYDFITSDINTALSLYTTTQALAGPSHSYFNTNTTQALYARMALQMNDWEQAFNASNTVINTSGVALTTKENYIAEWELDECNVFWGNNMREVV